MIDPSQPHLQTSHPLTYQVVCLPFINAPMESVVDKLRMYYAKLNMMNPIEFFTRKVAENTEKLKYCVFTPTVIAELTKGCGSTTYNILTAIAIAQVMGAKNLVIYSIQDHFTRESDKEIANDLLNRLGIKIAIIAKQEYDNWVAGYEEQKPTIDAQTCFFGIL